MRQTSTDDGGSSGALIGAIVGSVGVVIVAAAGGAWFYMRMDRAQTVTVTKQESTKQDSTAEQPVVAPTPAAADAV